MPPAASVSSVECAFNGSKVVVALDPSEHLAQALPAELAEVLELLARGRGVASTTTWRRSAGSSCRSSRPSCTSRSTTPVDGRRRGAEALGDLRHAHRPGGGDQVERLELGQREAQLQEVRDVKPGQRRVEAIERGDHAPQAQGRSVCQKCSDSLDTLVRPNYPSTRAVTPFASLSSSGGAARTRSQWRADERRRHRRRPDPCRERGWPHGRDARRLACRPWLSVDCQIEHADDPGRIPRGRFRAQLSGWGGRIRTFDLLIQSQAPYRLATPQWAARYTSHAGRQS